MSGTPILDTVARLTIFPPIKSKIRRNWEFRLSNLHRDSGDCGTFGDCHLGVLRRPGYINVGDCSFALIAIESLMVGIGIFHP